jgi:hypothetical protein
MAVVVMSPIVTVGIVDSEIYGCNPIIAFNQTGVIISEPRYPIPIRCVQMLKYIGELHPVAETVWKVDQYVGIANILEIARVISEDPDSIRASKHVAGIELSKRPLKMICDHGLVTVDVRPSVAAKENSACASERYFTAPPLKYNSTRRITSLASIISRHLGSFPTGSTHN